MRLAGLSVAIFLAVQGYAYGQDRSAADRAVRQVDRVGREAEKLTARPQKVEEPAFTPPVGPPIVASPSERRFFVHTIVLTGCESFPPKEFTPITSRYENRELVFSDLEVLAREIEHEYLRRGIIAAVFIPPQEVREASVTLRVVESRMGELEIQPAKYFEKDRLRYYWPIRKGEVLRYDELSTSLRIMGRNPDREVKAALRAGKASGTTDVVLTQENTYPLHFMMTYDNGGAITTGRERTDMGIRHNNFLFIDDTLMTGFNYGKDFSTVYLYHSVPVTPWGTTLIYGYSSGWAAPKKDYLPFGIKSQAVSATASFHQDFYNKGDYIGEAYLGMNLKDKYVKWRDGVLDRDRLRMVTMGGTYIYKELGSISYITPEFVQGITGLLGASDSENPLASRGADSIFSKFKLTLQHRRLLPLDIQENVKVTAQYAPNKLAPQEEISVGGINSVRGYPDDDYTADSALLVNLDLIVPLYAIPDDWRLPYAPDAVKDEVKGVLFIDYGHGERMGDTPDERKWVDYVGIGAGVRASLYNQINTRLEWGFTLGDGALTTAGHSRFHFMVDFQDKIPQEVERIRRLMEEEKIKRWAWALVDEELKRPESPVRKKLYHYLALARTYHEKGELKKALEFYKRIDAISTSLYEQAEAYVRSSVIHKKELMEYRTQALAKQKAGKLEEAKDLWQKVVIEARPRPLALRF